MKLSFQFLWFFYFSFVSAIHGFEVKTTPQGISIDTGSAGVYVMSYPRLLNPMDQGLNPELITVKADGRGAAMSYKPSGKLTLDKQPDGSWLYHVSEIPPDRIKFSFGIKFPQAVVGAEATWSIDGGPATSFPKVKGSLNLYQGNPKTFIFTQNKAGFLFTFPQRTWTVFSDQRVWGKDYFDFGQIFYFPGKKTIPEISYTFKVENLPAQPTSAPLQ